jgi:hypothetical protein
MTEAEIKAALEQLEADPDFITKSAYRANAQQWPDNVIPFVEVHLQYLKEHPKLNPEHYLSNLKLRIRRRS